jgi:hypothetical protein
MSLVLRPMLVRPTVLARPLICTSLLHPSSRAFSISARAAIQAAKPHQASTALKTEVREREVAADKKIVGSEGKGAEGLHYQGEWGGVAGHLRRTVEKGAGAVSSASVEVAKDSACPVDELGVGAEPSYRSNAAISYRSSGHRLA